MTKRDKPAMSEEEFEEAISKRNRVISAVTVGLDSRHKSNICGRRWRYG